MKRSTGFYDLYLNLSTAYVTATKLNLMSVELCNKGGDYPIALERLYPEMLKKRSLCTYSIS